MFGSITCTQRRNVHHTFLEPNLSLYSLCGCWFSQTEFTFIYLVTSTITKLVRYCELKLYNDTLTATKRDCSQCYSCLAVQRWYPEGSKVIRSSIECPMHGIPKLGHMHACTAQQSWLKQRYCLVIPSQRKEVSCIRRYNKQNFSSHIAMSISCAVAVTCTPGSGAGVRNKSTVCWRLGRTCSYEWVTRASENMCPFLPRGITGSVLSLLHLILKRGKWLSLRHWVTNPA